MLIEITGTSVHNKGAELMLAAIARQCTGHNPSVDLAVDLSFGSFKDRVRYGLLQKVEIRKPGRSRLALSLMPESFRKAIGVIRDAQLGAVLDASGFAFGDQHPLERLQQFAGRAEQLAAAGKPLILLPQALGPFDKPGYAEAMQRVMSSATLVYARDRVSHQHVLDAAGPSDKLRIAPDFTCLLDAGVSKQVDTQRVLVVPNQRMVEQAPSTEHAQAYVSLLTRFIQVAWHKGLAPAILRHGDDDQALCDHLQKASDKPLEIIAPHDPIEIKRILGGAAIVFGSRFHALVSALSQGVPAMATSWSHKYEMLFEDFGCPDFVLGVDAGTEQLARCLDKVLNEFESVRQEICARAEDYKQASIRMWAEVFAATIDH